VRFIYYILLFVSLICIFSCEKTSNTLNTCPDLINNISLSDYPTDIYSVNEVRVEGEELLINVTYGGGCEDHDFSLIKPPLFCGTPPISLIMYLSHDSHNDACFAIVTEHNLCFDISEIFELYLNEELTLYFSHPDSLYDLN
jgi:hypothetical protein